MRFGGLSHAFGRIELLVEIFEIAVVVITIVEAIRRDPKDRVLLFEVSAFVTFFLGLLVFKFSGVSVVGSIIWLGLFFGLTLAAAYFALVNWLRRTKRVS